ncbi:hypothetical protein ACFOWM_01050 [Ferruginibacter yonginensis]|uniref:3-oxoacyl-ACP synthase n=1 Tax=Ferruginibacter yonginensis TaxID=1310416 RepID=A0ABV8QMA9_9BACT
MSFALKQQIHNTILNTINSNITRLQQQLHELQLSAANETKSTAGDKYETALAMLQIEQHNTKIQLQQALEQKAMVANIDPTSVQKSIQNGSLIITSEGYFYIAVAMQKIIINQISIYPLSLQSPLGKAFLSFNHNKPIIFQNKIYNILQVM